VLEIVLTREDANTESALLAEWLVEDGHEVRKGQPVCLVETTKASVEIEAPGAGTIVQLFAQGTEVELGRSIAMIAESGEELESLRSERAPQKAAAAAPSGSGRATRKARELAEQHGIDLDSIEKAGFVTAEDVEALVATSAERPADVVLAGVSTENVTLPASLGADERAGALEPDFLSSLQTDPDAFRALSSEEKCDAYRRHGAVVGDGVVLGEGTLVVAPRIVLEDGVELGPGSTVRCEEVVALGALTSFGAGLRLSCRRAFVGANVWAGGSVEIGGGGNRDPWATLAVGDLAFIGAEAFVNVCRPVLIGREVFLTMRSMIVTHNIGHSLLEGFENRFAPVVLEDRSQVGMGSVVYAGCRIRREAIVASSSYVVSDIPAGKLAIGVPARVAGDVKRSVPRPRQVELARRMLDELHELLALRGHDVSIGADGIELRQDGRTSRVLFVERLVEGYEPPAADGETVVLTLELAAKAPPEGCSVLDLLGRRMHGEGSLVLDSVRELCRKRGIRFEPGPWRYRSGLI
jgi:acetyltransferase-like isoleucine patch superfamily enzyme